MNMIDFCIVPFDDVWARDNGPIFVYDQHKILKIWGMKTPFAEDA